MQIKNYISSYCKIKNNKVILNGNVIFESSTDNDLKDFLKKTYQFLNLKYGKFFKMDNLSKIAFLTTEFIINDSKINTETENIAIVFSNNASSLDTDRKHQKSIDNTIDYYPSPAIFVYTLPNIGIGEISIRHQLKSENAFFIFNSYNAAFHKTYENSLIQTNKATAVLSGWVNVDNDNNYETFIYLVSKKGNIEHNKNQLNKLYKD